ncbi:sac3 ganp family protein [Cystoisospora suis]|uniref:Sac3 ganp family protein n=1 Tax=Cystoisospora suis TaxID=483139 RepID=A0A2C6LC86_9APIC|nr:sac3 ganp family protein [Cystoisospora suis]
MNSIPTPLGGGMPPPTPGVGGGAGGAGLPAGVHPWTGAATIGGLGIPHAAQGAPLGGPPPPALQAQQAAMLAAAAASGGLATPPSLPQQATGGVMAGGLLGGRMMGPMHPGGAAFPAQLGMIPPGAGAIPPTQQQQQGPSVGVGLPLQQPPPMSAAHAFGTYEEFLAYAKQQYTAHYFGYLRQLHPPEIAMQHALACVEKLQESGFLDQLRGVYQAQSNARNALLMRDPSQAQPPQNALNAPVAPQANAFLGGGAGGVVGGMVPGGTLPMQTDAGSKSTLGSQGPLTTVGGAIPPVQPPPQDQHHPKQGRVAFSLKSKGTTAPGAGGGTPPKGVGGLTLTETATPGRLVAAGVPGTPAASSGTNSSASLGVSGGGLVPSSAAGGLPSPAVGGCAAPIPSAAGGYGGGENPTTSLAYYQMAVQGQPPQHASMHATLMAQQQQQQQLLIQGATPSSSAQGGDLGGGTGAGMFLYNNSHVSLSASSQQQPSFQQGINHTTPSQKDSLAYIQGLSGGANSTAPSTPINAPPPPPPCSPPPPASNDNRPLHPPSPSLPGYHGTSAGGSSLLLTGNERAGTVSSAGDRPSSGFDPYNSVQGAVEAAARAAAAMAAGKIPGGVLSSSSSPHLASSALLQQPGTLSGGVQGGNFDIQSARDQALQRAAEAAKDLAERKRQQGLLGAQAFSLWIQRLLTTHLTPEKGADWRRQVNLYSHKLTQDFRLGLLGGRDWSSYPIPSEEEIRLEVEKNDLAQSSLQPATSSGGRSSTSSVPPSGRSTSASDDPYRGSRSHRQQHRRSSRSRSRSLTSGGGDEPSSSSPSIQFHSRTIQLKGGGVYRRHHNRHSTSSGDADGPRSESSGDWRHGNRRHGEENGDSNEKSRHSQGGGGGDDNEDENEDFISLLDAKGKTKGSKGARQVQLLRSRAGKSGGQQQQQAWHGGGERKDSLLGMLIKCTPQEEEKRLQRMNRFGLACNSAPATGGSTSSTSDFNNKEDSNSSSSSSWKVSWMLDSSGGGSMTPSSSTSGSGGGGLTWQEKLEIAKSTEKIVGTSTALEKTYLRLTNAPDPATVRPPEILKKAFEHVLQKHKEGSATWRYVEEQFRSIRQDLTVQGIKNDFVRRVYETNGRLALSYHDLGQFNQCQTQLRDLYKRLQVPENDPERLEYLCYRLVYMALQGMRLDVLRVMSEMTVKERTDPSVVYAMKVRRALADGNFRRYFYLASIGPHSTKHLCEIFEPRMRMLALVCMTKASLNLQPKKIQEELHFSSMRETIDFLQKEGAVFSVDGKVDSKKSLVHFEKSSLLSKKVKAMG